MTRCACGKILGESRGGVTVLVRPCRCGLPARKVTFGAPHIWMPWVNPERERVGLPNKTPAEEALETTWV